MQSIQLIEFAFMLVIDLMFMVALVLLMLPLGIWRQAAFAVMKRNFVGYFSNPTGYVFLCLFVLLTSFAAFWPHEFFTTNLANFDQLNKFLPYIMLIFIPAITMSIWAEERRQGTDELLLTLPAKDFDIVIGKYFAAVLVFTVSLLFSQLSNYAVLLAMTGGQLDNYLLFSTYLGYWFMGIAMISLGMVASFLTSNLTVGFIFGAALNAPLAFFSNADVIFSNSLWIQRLFDWSLLQRFEPFGRGLVSLPSICYFLGIVAIGIYLSLVLIGRRHWLGGRDGTSLLWHFLVRAACLLVIAIGVVLVAQHSPLNRARIDISEAQVSTLAPATVKILDDLAKDQDADEPTINIEAYVSSSVPSEYVKLKYDLVNLLREFDVLGGGRVDVNLHQGIEPFSEEAILAEKKYGIRPVSVPSQSRGAMRNEDLILGMAISCGLERIVIPFMPYGTSVEYELMRSINTVSRGERKTIGVLQTDALVMGATLKVGGEDRQIPRLAILNELEKQYNVENVDASSPISLWVEDEDGKPLRRRYDVLLAVQPSQTTPAELENLITAIQSGQPTAIFEDPLPSPENFEYVRPTFYPRFIARGGSQKAEIQKLWDALDLDIDRQRRPTQAGQQLPELWPFVVWQLADDNPYPRNRQLDEKERVVVREYDKTIDPRFSKDFPATSELEELYFQFVGYLRATQRTELEFDPLVTTSFAGRLSVFTVIASGNNSDVMDRDRGSADQQFTLAAYIHGKQASDDLPTTTAVKTDKQKTNVIYVADVDTLADYYSDVRDFPVANGVEYRFQNVSFVLNVIDQLAGEDAYFGLRNRRIEHKTLRTVEATYEKAMNTVYELDQDLTIELETKLNEARDEMKSKVDPLERDIRREMKRKEEGKHDAEKLAALQSLMQSEVREQETKFQAKRQALVNERREAKRQIDLTAQLEIQKIQRQFKLAAVVIPPIPPLLVGLIVFTRRRLREREGISKARRLK